MELKKLPIGIENYKTVAKECYYVDKTLLLKKRMDATQGCIFLFTLPRCFGKSLVQPMIQTFFELGENSKEHFKGTNIKKEDTHYLSQMNQYPVIPISMKHCIGKNFEETFNTSKRKCLLLIANSIP